ncbi:MAG: hypothetical protein O7167_00710 [Wolbachia endosymbiont of Andrena nigroaenea]|nr:hypothetical protein [Wolbachia endosymbiont of Andrena nigroaenea]
MVSAPFFVIPVWNLVLIVHLLGVELSFLDPSSQATRMTPSWMETSVSYFHDTMTTVIPLLVSGIYPRR